MADTLHKIENGLLSVTVNRDGAQLWSICGRDGTEYLWQGDPKYWPDRSISIFPYVARLTEGSYYMDGELHHMGIHGFAAASMFTAAKHERECLVLELEDNEETYAQYPRRFLLRNTFCLKDNTLEVRFEVENRDCKNMYFGIGGHPGFQVPLCKDKDFTEYRLRFHESCDAVRVGFSDDCYVNGQDEPFVLEKGQILKLHHDLFDHDAIVLKKMAKAVTLETDGDERYVTVSYPQMPYLGIWHMPRTDAPYVCIEPWSSLPSSKGKVAVFEEQEDLIVLEPGKRYENVWTITIG